MSNEKHQELYTKIFWIFTTFMLLSAMPLGIVLILVKLFERRRKGKAKRVFRPVPGAPVGAQTIRPGVSSPIRECLDDASHKMRRRVTVGVILTILCAVLTSVCAANDISLWTIGWSLFCSAYYMFTGLQYVSSVGRFRGYIDAMEKKPVMTVGEMAAATGRKETVIRRDWMNVEFMELLPGIFFDRKQDMLFCF